MKEVILSADGDSMVYLVPDEVADNLIECCMEFCQSWLVSSPDAEKYRMTTEDGEVGLCFCESDFIDYLNEHAFPEYKSRLIKNLGCTNLDKDIPSKYKGLPYFNF